MMIFSLNNYTNDQNIHKRSEYTLKQHKSKENREIKTSVNFIRFKYLFET